MVNVATGKHTHDHACILPVPEGAGPTRALSTYLTLAPHTSSLQVQGRAEASLPGAWGTSKATLRWHEQCPLPQQLQELRKEPWGQQPTLMCAPHPPNASRQRQTHVSRELPVFCSLPSVSQDRELSVTLTPPLLHVPNGDAVRVPRPPHLSLPGSRAPVGMRGWASLWLSPGASGGGCCLGG